MAGFAASIPAIARALQITIDGNIAKKLADQIPTIGLNNIAIMIVVIFGLRAVTGFGQKVIMHIIGLRVIADIQNDISRHVLGLDTAFFSKKPPGDMIARIVADVQMMRTAAVDVLTTLGKEVFMIIGVIYTLLVTNMELALMILVFGPPIMIPVLFINRYIRKATRKVRIATAEMTTSLDEVFHGIRSIKGNAMEDFEEKRIRKNIKDVLRPSTKAAVVASLMSPITDIVAGAAMVVIFLLGGSAVYLATDSISGITPGDFAAFVSALLLLPPPMKKVLNVNAQVQMGLAAAERVFEILDTEATIVDSKTATDLTNPKGDVIFTNVDFTYSDQLPVLQDVSITIPGGKTVALVGASGAGKTSILNALARFYEVSNGSVKIGKQDIRDVKLASLRSNMALVSQDALLFDDTVRANIAYGRLDATEEEIVFAAKAAEAWNFISSFPDGLETSVGTRGSSLSGGQRQRIAIARAILRDAPILLLDEATSALDNETEAKVQQALQKLMVGRTTLIVAHRLSTIQNADLIYVMDKGSVAESGNHDELMAANGLYSRFHSAYAE